MKRLLIATLATFMTLSAPGAFAASAVDVIKSMDVEAYTVTLNDGQIYIFPADYDLAGLKAGDKVEIMFEADEGKNTATGVKSAM